MRSGTSKTMSDELIIFHISFDIFQFPVGFAGGAQAMKTEKCQMIYGKESVRRTSTSKALQVLSAGCARNSQHASVPLLSCAFHPQA